MDIKNYNEFFLNSVLYSPPLDCKITCSICNTSSLKTAYGYKTYDMCIICYSEKKPKSCKNNKFIDIDLSNNIDLVIDSVDEKPKISQRIKKFICCCNK